MSWPAAARAFAQLGAMHRSTIRDRNGDPVTKPKSQWLGADLTAIVLATARLDDLGLCITAANAARYAGQSTPTVAAKMRRMDSWLARAEPTCNGAGCGARRRHYRIEF